MMDDEAGEPGATNEAGRAEAVEDAFDCLTCGRCCHHEPRTVALYRDDEARMGEPLMRRLTLIDARGPGFRFMHNDGTRCAALDVSVPGRFPCAVYEHRPGGCRTVEPGSPCCIEARRLGHLGTSLGFERLPKAQARPV